MDSMDSLKNVSDTKHDYIANLSEQGLEQLLQGLSRKYYQAYVNGDVDRVQSTLSFIKDVEMIVEDKQIAFDVFVNYCMLCNANFIIKTLFKNDIELKPYGDLSLRTNTAVDNLTSAFKRNKYAFIDGSDRINIKNLYGMCVADESLDGDIMELVETIYNSFIDKENYRNDVGDVND